MQTDLKANYKAAGHTRKQAAYFANDAALLNHTSPGVYAVSHNRSTSILKKHVHTILHFQGL